jgi:hypothetical protein
VADSAPAARNAMQSKNNLISHTCHCPKTRAGVWAEIAQFNTYFFELNLESGSDFANIYHIIMLHVLFSTLFSVKQDFDACKKSSGW